MKCILWFFAAALLSFSTAAIAEVAKWEHVPIPVLLYVGQERVVLIDGSVRVGAPPSVEGRLRVQTVNGAMYLRATVPIETTRLQIQDFDSGAIVLIDVTATKPQATDIPLEPFKIVTSTPPQSHPETGTDEQTPAGEEPNTPIPVVLTRFASQSLYAPLRSIEPVPGIVQVPLKSGVYLDSLLPSLPVQARALACWRLKEFTVAAIAIRNQSNQWVQLDPRLAQGDFVTATLQHPNLGPKGETTDTTVLYLVVRGTSWANALVPGPVASDRAVSAKAGP